jgi:energy-coupling factor transport system substrate-specific component
LQEAGTIVSQHHERYDGKGYPDGLKGETIHIGARIMAIADTYDAMTSNRSYRKALNPDYAVKEIKNEAGAQFDPQCVEAFLQYLCEDKTTEQ